ncbi:hypothetical protein KO504_04085 [Winogradskyella psychrotolerans]|uniref:hypothetical protein n=1 Tax=Winogradskyella psychrotolerans TaxID=1344585 RepID=UPI001C06D0BE|nr:hypothetical protein [Winogradskyella psychrotolerans]MBU2920509.1 hypothetical protein [Winogradskyella psychrotolerans]
MTKENFQNDIEIKDSPEIFLNYLQGNQIWYFRDYLKVENPSETYDEFKKFVSKSLGVSFNNVCIVGSGKLGYSLSPEKNFSDFNEDESDIDLVIVSRKYYYQFWNAYLDLFEDKVNIGYKYITSTIFRRFISIKEPKPIHPFFKEWISRIEKFNKDYQLLFGIKHDINYRIYDSWESVERYHIKGIQEIKELNTQEN